MSLGKDPRLAFQRKFLRMDLDKETFKPRAIFGIVFIQKLIKTSDSKPISIGQVIEFHKNRNANEKFLKALTDKIFLKSNELPIYLKEGVLGFDYHKYLSQCATVIYCKDYPKIVQKLKFELRMEDWLPLFAYEPKYKVVKVYSDESIPGVLTKGDY